MNRIYKTIIHLFSKYPKGKAWILFGPAIENCPQIQLYIVSGLRLSAILYNTKS